MNPKWHAMTMNDVMAEFYDGPHATPPPADEGPIYLGIKNMTEDGHLDLSEIRHISESDYPTWTRRVEPRAGDLIFTYEASLHRYAIIPEGFRGTLGRRVALLRPRADVVDTRFLLYLFTSPQWRNVVQRRINIGATVDRLPLTDFPQFPVRIPDLPTQRKIAAVLSAYDDLIENNSRRIRLLEEMAQRIYREWFINFRYPGHQDVPLVDSTLGKIPAGWSAGRWGQYATLDYGRALRGYREDAGQYPVFGTIGQIGWCDRALFPPGVIVGRKGAYRGIRLSTTPCWVIDTAFYLRLGDNVPLDSMYAYHQLRTIDLDDIDSGSAIPSTSRDAFYAIPLIVPPDYLVRRFSLLAGELDTCQRLLAKQGDNLRATRGLLLPLLISGEVDVTDLDIEVPEAAA
jgi:type I restriction enzyme S subunit